MQRRLAFSLTHQNFAQSFLSWTGIGLAPKCDVAGIVFIQI